MKTKMLKLAAVVAAFAVVTGCASSKKAVPASSGVNTGRTSKTANSAGGDELDHAIREISDYLNKRIPKGTKAVFLNIKSDWPDLSEYILSSLMENAVNDEVFTIVDRQQLDLIRAEQNFQWSGEVSDASAQEIGQLLGAQTIVSGAITTIGSIYRIQARALSVQTAAVQGQFSQNVSNKDQTVAALTTRVAPADTPTVAIGTRTNTATPASPAQPAQTPIPVTQPPQQISEENLIGVWKGSYYAGQGETAMILTVYKEGGRYVAICDFYNLPGKSNAKEGKFSMDVSYNREREKFYLKAVKWIERPAGYGFADLEGTINGDVFSGFLSGGSNTFRLVRDRAIQANPAAPAQSVAVTEKSVTSNQPKDGTYTFYPRPVGTKGGINADGWLVKIVIRSGYFNLFLTNKPVGKGTRGGLSFGPPSTLILQDLVNPAKSYNAIMSPRWDEETGCYIITFQNVTSNRLSYIETKPNPPWVIEQIILGEPDK